MPTFNFLYRSLSHAFSIAREMFHERKILIFFFLKEFKRPLSQRYLTNYKCLASCETMKRDTKIFFFSFFFARRLNTASDNNNSRYDLNFYVYKIFSLLFFFFLDGGEFWRTIFFSLLSSASSLSACVSLQKKKREIMIIMKILNSPPSDYVMINIDSRALEKK